MIITSRGERCEDYKRYLRSLHWKLLKARTVERGVCEFCGETEPEQWDVHHTTYDRIGNERDEDLMLVCHDCHTWIHTDLEEIEPVRQRAMQRVGNGGEQLSEILERVFA